MYSSDTRFKKFVSFEYGIIIFFDSTKAIMMDRWSLNVLIQIEFTSESELYKEVYLLN